MLGEYCDKECGTGCLSGCDQYTGQCMCKLGWQSDRCEGMLLKLIQSVSLIDIQ